MEEGGFITDPKIENKTQKKKTTFNQPQIPQQQTPPKRQQQVYKQPEEEKEFDPVERERYWELIWKKISFVPKNKRGEYDAEYYQQDQFAQVRPGIDLWQAIVKAEKYQKIKINIPDTLISYNDTQYYMYTNPENGCLVKKPEASWQEMEKNLQDANREFSVRFAQKNEKYPSYRKFNQHHDMSEVEELLDYRKNSEVPFLIQRYKGKLDWLGSTQVLPYSKREEKKGPLETGEILQRYIFSKPLKATILRLQFYTKNSNCMSANYGYRIMNRIDCFDRNTKRNLDSKCTTILDSDKESDNYNVKVWPGKTINEFSIEVQLVKGVGLKEYERQAEELCKLLERNNNVRISEIVCDFIQDLDGKIWFINCRGLKLEQTKTMKDLLTATSQEVQPGEDAKLGKNTLNQLTCSVYCKLCGIKFKKDEASKVLTYKLLWELVQHLKKRNIYLKNIKVSHKTTRPCRVCNLCYMLVVGEHELIEIEQQFAIAQNIMISDPTGNKKGSQQVNELNDAVIRVPIDSKPKHRPALLSEQLYQWRLIFYIIEISNIGTEHNIDFKNLYFQFKLNKFQTSFKVDSSQNDAFNNTSTNKSLKNATSTGDIEKQQLKYKQMKENLSTVNINKIKVHYLFSEEMDISKFLTETEIKVRLTQGPDWNSFLAEGSSKTIHHFKNKIKQGQRHSSQVLLFFENSKYCILTLNIGLVCDNQYNTAKLNLYKFNNIYFPDENYYNSNPFPNEWCEMFDPHFLTDKDDLEDNKGTEKYSPKCSQADLNKMIDFNSYKSKSKYKNVQSKVSQMIRTGSAKTMDANLIRGLQGDTSKNFLSPSYAGNTTDAGLFPSTTKNLVTKPPISRAQTAKHGRQNASEGNLKRPISNKLQPINKNQSEIPQNQQIGNFFGGNKQESYKFLLDKKHSGKQRTDDEKDIFKKYSEFENIFSDDDDNINDLDDSADDVIREKLMQHFKKVNKIDEENEEQILQGAQKRRVQSGIPYSNRQKLTSLNSNDQENQDSALDKQQFNDFINKKKIESNQIQDNNIY